MKHLSPAEIETISVPEPKEPRFIRWLAKQPSNGTYNYVGVTKCGYAQYLRSRHIIAIVSPGNWIGLWFGIVPVFGEVPRIYDDALVCRPWTFSAALTRARTALASQKGDANG